MIDRGHDFMVRVGSNVTLIGETFDYEELEGGEVLCWPNNLRRRNTDPANTLLRIGVSRTP